MDHTKFKEENAIQKRLKFPTELIVYMHESSLVIGKTRLSESYLELIIFFIQVCNV